VLDDPRTQVVIDDARHFLATTNETFDIITTDPIHPWVKGAAALYTAEFFGLCRQHLNRGGMVAQWIPLYESNEEAVKCELATFVQAFPFATMWSGESRHEGYDVVAVGSLESTCEPALVAHRVLANLDVGQSLREVEIESTETLQRMFTAYGSDLKQWLKDAQINCDCNLRLQYLAGRTPHGRVQQGLIERMTQLNSMVPVSDSRDVR
jgi:spermidine synthase